MDRKWPKEIHALQELRESGKISPAAFKKETKQLDQKAFVELCDKSKYTKKCDPSYCTPSYTNTCEYLKFREEMTTKLNLSKDYTL